MGLWGSLRGIRSKTDKSNIPFFGMRSSISVNEWRALLSLRKETNNPVTVLLGFHLRPPSVSKAE